MRVKVRFNVEGNGRPNPAIFLDLRFLPRAGEQIHVGFRQVIEVLEVHRVDNDSRCAGILRARYVEEGRRAPAPPPPVRPLPSTPARTLSVTPVPASAAIGAAVFGDLSLEDLRAVHAQSAGVGALAALTDLAPEPAL